MFKDPVIKDNGAPKDATSTNTGDSPTKLINEYNGFALKPSRLLKQYKENRNGSDTQAEFFVQMTNFVPKNHSWNDGSRLLPSSHLNVVVSNDQESLLNSTIRDVQIGALINQAYGKRAKKMEPK